MSLKPILNEKGQVVGYNKDGDTYLNEKGQLVARVRYGTTYDAKGAPKGKGDQGLRLLEK